MQQPTENQKNAQTEIEVKWETGLYI